jgi:hypothetical protein
MAPVLVSNCGSRFAPGGGCVFVGKNGAQTQPSTKSPGSWTYSSWAEKNGFATVPAPWIRSLTPVGRLSARAVDLATRRACWMTVAPLVTLSRCCMRRVIGRAMAVRMTTTKRTSIISTSVNARRPFARFALLMSHSPVPPPGRGRVGPSPVGLSPRPYCTCVSPSRRR